MRIVYVSPSGNFEVYDDVTQPAPPPGYYTVEEWEAAHPAPAPTLDEVKEAKISEFKGIRDAEEVEPIEYNGYMFDFDEKARERIRYAYSYMERSGMKSQNWTTADNQEAAVTVEDLRSIEDAAAIRSGILHGKYRQLREIIDICETVEEVSEITWDE